jgi:glutathione synthase/RimK-type ligase-like ATP-grasp enzyme
MRFSSVGKIRHTLAREIEDQFDYPIIMRTLTNQQGIGMSKIDSWDALIELLLAGCPQQFFVTQFVDTKGKNQFYRKIRAAVVGDEIMFNRVDYDTYWNVHGRKKPHRWTFYRENIHLLDQEKRICNEPEAELGRPVIQSLRAIRERIPLDAFGIDFDVDADGRLVFYEANATMNLFSTAPKDIPNPKESGERLKLAFQRFLTSLVAAAPPRAGVTV